MSQKKEKKEKEAPIMCKCGQMPIIVKTKMGKMVSCQDPMNCVGAYRTTWNSSEDLAISEWNNLIRFGGK